MNGKDSEIRTDQVSMDGSDSTIHIACSEYGDKVYLQHPVRRQMNKLAGWIHKENKGLPLIVYAMIIICLLFVAQTIGFAVSFVKMRSELDELQPIKSGLKELQLNKTGRPTVIAFEFHFCQSMRYRASHFWILPALIGTSWPYDQFCIAISRTDPALSGDYEVSLDMLLTDAPSGHGGQGGIMFNVVDEINYDLIFMTAEHHTKDYCFDYGFVQNDRYSRVGHGACTHGGPKHHSWFNLKVVVRDANNSTVRLNNLLLGDIKPHFPPRSVGGAFTLNRLNYLMFFKNYRLKPLQE